MKTEVAFQHAYEKETDRNEMERGKKSSWCVQWVCVCECTECTSKGYFCDKIVCVYKC